MLSNRATACVSAGKYTLAVCREADAVDVSGRSLSGIVVKPEDMVVTRRQDRPGELDLQTVLAQVRDLVASCERSADDPRDEGVDLGLIVVLVRRESELQRKPDAARVGPLAGEAVMHGDHGREPFLVHADDGEPRFVR